MECRKCGDRPDLEYDEGYGNADEGYTCWSCYNEFKESGL